MKPKLTFLLSLTFLFSVVFLLTGCTSSVQKKLDSFIGMNILDAQKDLGYMFQTRQLSDGNIAYIWTQGSSMGYISGGIGGLVSHRCEIAFITNSTGKIISNQFSDTSLDSATCYGLLK